jgi:predicted SnoaL-like aldol condensation-catalyzing enzyme
MLGDGLAPILAFMDALPADKTKVNVLRAFEDGEYSVAHADYELGDWGKMVGFEVHRWENDRIVEHWDNLQPTPQGFNSSGHTMTDGVCEVADIELTRENKAMIQRFTENVLIERNFVRAESFFHHNQLIQHSPLCGDGAPAFLEMMGGADTEPGSRRYTRLHMLLGEGNLVLAISEGTRGNESGTRQPAAFYDLYRLEHGFISEHWDVVEIIPPRDQWQNENGKF